MTMSSEATPLVPASGQGNANDQILILNTAEMKPVDYDWSAIKWICDRKTTPDSQQSFGYAFLNPGGVNPEHRHRTCEEIIFMLAGELNVYADGKCITIRPGQTALIPPGVRHRVANEGWEPVVYIASFSAPFRDTVFKGQTGRLDEIEKLY
jgi:putative monooxygenase